MANSISSKVSHESIGRICHGRSGASVTAAALGRHVQSKFVGWRASGRRMSDDNTARRLLPVVERPADPLQGSGGGGMTQDELRRLGHRPMTPLQALRAHCVDCSGHDPSEVARCTVTRCPSWPFRLGRNPWRTATEAQREASRRNARFLQPGHRQNHEEANQRPTGTAQPAPAAETAAEPRENDETEPRRNSPARGAR